MKKKYFGFVIFIVLSVFLLSTPYYLGIKAEQSLNRQHHILSNTSFLIIESRDYQRGWFSSEENVSLRFHPSFLAKLRPQLPENLKILLEQPITVKSHIRHSLFANGLIPVRGVVESEFIFQEESRQILQRFFGNQAPITLHNTIALNGSGELNWQIPAFEYSELSGIAIQWQGLQGHTEYSKAFAEYHNRIHTAGIALQLADKGSIAFEQFTLESHSHDNGNAPQLGSTQMKLGSLKLTWSEDIQYDIKLNNFINTVSDLQIGSFINPYGKIEGNSLTLTDLTAQTDTTGNTDLIDTQGQFGFARLEYGNQQYGPLQIHASAKQLDAAALGILRDKTREWAAQNLDEAALRQAMLDTIRGEAAALFTRNPQLALEKFELTLPQGQVSANASLVFQDLQQDDLNRINSMMQKGQAKLNISLPQSLIEQLAVSQARQYISVDPELGNADAEISQAVSLWVANMIDIMAQDGYLKVDNGMVSTQIELKGNQLSMNGKEIARDDQADLLPDDVLAE